MALLLADRMDIPADEEMIHFLSQGKQPSGLVQACLRKIEDDPHSPAAVRAVRLLGRLRICEVIPTLLSALYHEDDYLSEAAEDALCEMGEAVLPHIEPVLRDGRDDDIMPILSLLGRLPYPGTVEIILSHFERLHQINREDLVYSIEELGSRRFIPQLKEYLTEDEPEEEVFQLLCWLHEIDDPELPRIERALASRKKEDEQMLAQLQAGDETAFIRETIPLLLRCIPCGRTYTYSVREVIVDREDKEMREVYIRDPIICKYCRAEGQYEITAEARMAITANLVVMFRLVDTGKADLNQGPVKLATLAVGGKPMNPKEGLAYYQKEIGKHPDRAELRVGYGNLLLFWKKEGEAKAEFEKAVALDPLAIEALYSLAEMEIESGRFKEGYALYQRCLQSFDEGHFYRMSDEKREEFHEHLEVNLWELQKKLGLRPSPAQDLSGIAQEPIIRKDKVGRNDPCPCGSGKKYKRCCLGQEETKLHVSAPKTMVTEEEGRLTGRLVAFATSPRLRKDFKEASSLFFFKPISEMPDYSDEDPVFTQFIEWFIHDYVLAGGTTVIKEFARTQGRSVSAKEREILDGWIDPAISLYEVQESHPERAEIHLKGLFTGESFLVRDVSGSRRLVKWDLIGARVLRVGEEFRLSGVISYFPPRERASLVRFFTEKWDEYRKEAGEEHWDSFMKARGYLLYHYSLSRGEEVMPPLLTPENHEMVFGKAIYDVENFGGVIFRLKQEHDFQLGEEGEEAAGQKNVQFNWLKRGKSKDIIPEGPKREQGLVIQAAVLPSPESQGTLSLGNLTVTQSRLTLEVMSRERLVAGKRRIEELLGRYIRFRLDTFESVKAGLKRHEGHEAKEGPLVNIPMEEQEAVMRSLLARHIEQWIDTPIPALDGKTPLGMVGLPGGKERVGQLLKEMENTEERKRRAGEFYVDVNVLRKRLGFPPS
jgi:tetratricopeptide (TPR) repeat protein